MPPLPVDEAYEYLPQLEQAVMMRYDLLEQLEWGEDAHIEALLSQVDDFIQDQCDNDETKMCCLCQEPFMNEQDHENVCEAVQCVKTGTNIVELLA